MLQLAGEPTLAALNRTSTKTLPILKLHIVALDRFLHLKNPLSETEINFIAEQIIDEFGGALTFADVHLVLKDAKAGKYGKFYERLSAPDVLDWFRNYFSRRLDAAYEINLRNDKATYGHVPSASIHEQAANLARLGYVINPDGSLAVNPQRLAALEKARNEKDNQAITQKQKLVDQHNEEFLRNVQQQE